MVRAALTGGIATGKSFCLAKFAELGAATIDADVLARDAVAPGSQGLADVVTRFGDRVLRPDGTLDRAALGRVVFNDPDALRDLEAIVHPAVRPRILSAIDAAERAGAPAVVIEAIKLIEGGLAEHCDEVWLVTCDAAVQRERLVGRGTTPADAADRIAAQAGSTATSRVVTRVIDTSGDPASTRSAVEEAFDTARRAAAIAGRAGLGAEA